MNPKVQAFLDEEKVAEREIELQKRNEHLIHLGLIDDEKSGRKYKPYNFPNAHCDEEKKQWYEIEPVALEVTDEEYAEICKYNQSKTAAYSKEMPIDDVVRIAAKNISTIKKIMVFFTILWAIGVVLGIIIILIANN